ncbi:extracellular solute-binding protein [Neorhizobium galegae]|uniref:Ferric transporter ATP-binding subunit n=1 Tax=Neorhizobium galegae bv. officinalis TaxID=323656 RepID=A0A0T7GJ51_NEOGA|nr:extracellular solute-binding protein [Neorhizobium galegae]CDZ47309.1 Ferric transporter ATP-binding subunit [Neorhizobium galegae bv. officinalis]
MSLITKLAALMLGAMLCSPALAQDADWNKVVEAAKKEGTVTVYNSQLGAPNFLAVVESFQKKYGIKVESLDLRASELTERLRAEQAAGRFIADIQMHSANSIETGVTQGTLVQPLGTIPNVANIREDMRKEITDTHVPGFLQAYGILVNTSLVKPEDEPKSWKDLADPKWKGKILSDDMRPLGSGGTMFVVFHKALGQAFNEKLAENKPVFSRDLRNDAKRVARGEYPVYIPQMFAFANDLKGLPIKVIVPPEGVPYVSIHFAMMKNAPHPNASKLFINHFLDMESQVTYAKAWMLPVAKGVEDQLDPESKRFAGAKLLGTREMNEYGPMMDLAKKIYP